MEHRSQSVAGLDAASWATVRRFAVTAVLILVWTRSQQQEPSKDGLLAAFVAAAAMTAFLAKLFGEPFRGAALNRWDEAIALLGVGCAVGLLA